MITEKLYSYFETPISIRTQLKEIFKKYGLKYDQDVWEWFATNAISRYSDSGCTKEIVSTKNCSLVCHFCGHPGCNCLWSRELCTDDVVDNKLVEVNENLQIELPNELVCGSECIHLDMPIRRVIKAIKDYAGDVKIRLVNNKIDICSLQKELPVWKFLYLPQELVFYNYQNEYIPWVYEWATTGEFSWNLKLMTTRDIPKLKSTSRKSRMWESSKYGRGTGKNNYVYILLGRKENDR